MISFLEFLNTNSGCLYIYNRSSIVYGLPSDEFSEYTIVVSRDFVLPEDWTGLVISELCTLNYDVLVEGSTFYYIYNIDTWFNKVLNGDIDCWECACLNKKFIVKEYVKLMMKTDLVQLRKYVDSLITNISRTITLKQPVSVLDFWKVIKTCKFANQIIENHKIVNFKEAESEYHALQSEVKDSNLIERYQFDLALPYQLLRDRTDEILRKSKIKKVIQDE